MSDLKDQVNERRSGIDRRKSLLSEVKNLRKIVFNMLNFTNMYAIVLDNELFIKYANASLAIDLGYDDYTELIGKCWLTFIPKEERQLVSMVHKSVANGDEGWEKFREFKNKIVSIKNEEIETYWFNSHINTSYDWTFSFGIRKRPVIQDELNMNSLRKYYSDIIKKDREMITSMRQVIGLSDKIVDTCKPDFESTNIYV